MRGLATFCFFLSGASGLVFQVIWSRLFSLVFGTTTLALSTVLTAFMAGLGLGSYLSGRWADRLGDPLRAYALAEGGVGLFALALPFVVGTFGGLNRWAYQAFPDSYIILAIIRFVASSSVIIVPTTLMGATLPLLSRFLVSTETEHARIGIRVGTLYAINTLGAVLGTFFGGFVLLPSLGLRATNILAAGANLSIAALVLLAYAIRSRRTRHGRKDAPIDDEVASLLESIRPDPPVVPIIGPRARRWALIAFAFSGASAMIYQVIWSRVLAMNIGSSVYSFTLVLTTFLIGLAGGAAVIGRLSQRSRNPVGWLAINHILIVIFVGISYLLMDKLPFIYLHLIRGGKMQADAVLWRQFLLTALTMLPATFALGGIFPLTIRIAASSLRHVGKDVGTAYAINTMGAIVGSFLAGFVVIPILQMERGLFLAITTNLILAALLGSVAPWTRAHPKGASKDRRYRRRMQLGVGGVAATLIAIAPMLPRWDLYMLSVGFFRPTVARDALNHGGKWAKPQLVYYHDGLSTTVSVEKWSAKHFSIKNNGKVDASTGDDMPTQITVGLLPILLHPDTPKLHPRVLLIGFASGVTAGSILQYPVSHLDVVELEPAILKASRFFNHVNHRPLDDPRTHVVADDGRNYLSAVAHRYDIIINEPSNPWITGVSNLFTRDYFRIAAKRLAPGGIFCTWAQTYELAPRRIKAIYKAFSQVFPYVYAFSATSLSSDTFLLGSRRDLGIDIRRLRRVFAIPSVRAEMRRAHLDSPDDLLALSLLGPRGVRAFIAGARTNTDDNALVEFSAPRDLYNHKRYDYYVSKLYGYSWFYGRLDDFVSGYKTSEDYARLVRALLRHGRLREAEHDVAKIHAHEDPLSARATTLLTLVAPKRSESGEFPLDLDGPPLAPPNPPTATNAKVREQIVKDYQSVLTELRTGGCQKAINLIEKWPDAAREALNPDVHLLWGYLVYHCDQYRTAVNILSPLVKRPAFLRRRPALLFYLGKAMWGDADFANAVRIFERWIALRDKTHAPVTTRPVEDLP
ncbi:MAG: fused MFS/spermidine synthase [Deltaproteobacteria bacterium]|nr:fused MFS/spermidine synthase [Deltaproteobacteria bacterium]